jgi:SARP family transcriptional regulator, regulator of embCAB operon
MPAPCSPVVSDAFHGWPARGFELSSLRGIVASQASIRLCGSVSVELDGRAVHDMMRHGNELLLFAYLALERGRPVPRDEASAALWPNRRPIHEDAALRTVLSRLRAALGTGVIPSGSGLALRLPPDTRVDVFDAREAVGAARRCEDPQRALELAARARPVTERPLLPGFDRTWIDTRRRELADLRVDATEIVAWASLELEDFGTAESTARELVERAPLHESGYELLMRVLAKRRNVADALGVYERLRTILGEELGAAPGAALRALHASLLADETDVAMQRPVAMTVAELGELTRSIGAARATWEHLVRHDPRQRVFERVPSPPGTEAWLMCWMPGHDSGPHDHDISSGAVTVIEGELTEEQFGWDTSTSPIAYGPGETFGFGPSDVHRVVHSGAAPTIAIHAFSPPLRGLGSYARGRHGELHRHPLDPGDEVKAITY